MEIGSLTGDVSLTDKFSSVIESAIMQISAFGESTKTMGGAIAEFIENPLKASSEALKGFLGEFGNFGAGLLGIGTIATTAGTALFELTERAAAVGARLDDMADKTGLSVPALSSLSNAAQVIGADMGSLTNTIFMLQRGIGNNTEIFQAGLAKMGLSTTELKAVGPDRYLELVTAGLRNIPDSSDRASAGMAVLGRQYKSVAANLMDLDAGMKLTADLNPWTAEQAKAAEAFEQQIASIKVHISAAAIAFGNELIPAVSLLVSGVERLGIAVINVSGIPGYIKLFGALKGVMGETALAQESLLASTATANRLWAVSGATAESVATQMLALGYNIETVAMHSGAGAAAVTKLSGAMTTAKDEATALDEVWTRLNALESAGIPTLDGLSASTKGLVTYYQALGATVKDITLATGASAGQQTLLTAAHKEGEAAIKKYDEAWTNLAAVGSSWQETLQQIDAETISSVEYYLKAGASQGELATAFKLTAEQINAVSKSIEYQKTLTETLRTLDGEWAAERIKSLTTIEAAEAQLADMIHKSVLDTTNYQILRAWEVADQAEKAFAAMSGHTEEEVQRYSAAVEAIATETAQAARDAADSVTASTTGMAEEIETAMEGATGKTAQFKNTVYLVAKDLASLNAQLSDFYDALDVAGIGSSSKNSVGMVNGPNPQMLRIKGAGLYGLGHTANEVAFGQNAPVFGKQYAEGGPVAATGPALVHQGEYVVPAGGALVGGNTQPQIIQLIVDGQVLASVISDRMSRQTLQSRKFQ